MLREYIDQLDKLPQKAITNCFEIDTNKPLIGIISAQNELATAHNGLDIICQRIKDGILSNGANAKVVYIPSLDNTTLRGTQSAKYDLPSRDLTADAVELLCSNDFFDGVIFVASEPSVVSGMLLGAIRLNIPCAFVCQGVMTPIHHLGSEHGFTYYYEQVARVKTGKTSHEAVSDITRNLPLVLGTDCDSYGANSLNCVLEALGLAVRGNGTATAMSVERKSIAYKTSELVIKLVKQKCTPRRLLTQASLSNAIKLDLACGGSATTLLNMIAIAKELGIKNINLKTISELCKKTPLLLKKEKPTACLMKQFHKAGGVYAMLKQLLDGQVIADTQLYEDTTVSDMLSSVTVENPNVICPVASCVAPSARIRVINGNVAEDGALVQFNGTDTAFTGTAKIYINEEMAVEAILRREIHAGDVLVIRGEGPKSGPGMREIYVSLALLKGFGLEDKVAVITDGRIADIYNGFAVGHITPETGERNLFSVLQDGDEIEISITKAKVNCDIKAKDLAKRYRDSDQGVANYGNFFLKNWSKTCSTASEGCVYKGGK